MRVPHDLLPPPEPVAIPARPADGHKGTFGRVAVIAGSAPFTGAPYMTATAALRGGAGQARLLVARSIHPILAVKCTEIEVSPVSDGAPGALGSDSHREVASALAEWATVGVIGPGMGRHPATAQLIRLLSHTDRPLVIDADGLNALSEDRDMLPRLGEGGRIRILTPHPGEMSRLLQRPIGESEAERQMLALDAAQNFGVVVVLKGARTVVASPDGRVAIDPHSVPALATGGTGDILAGLIAALLAQGSDPFQAAVTGVYVHAATGRWVADRLLSGMLATDLLPTIPYVMQELREMGR
ncbi:MAG TPA: NAD(P)H-hydrate dehydratase [Anaeromyxobacteraceae bacterium]|nr:NAD(P)H-hydrate dehydratase [Anaeromyxobacteraceae bacterium]